MPVCQFCQKTVDPRVLGSFKRIDGWVENRGPTGGANAVFLRRDIGEYAHKWCVEQRRAGVAVDQQTMF